jgi:hypothetical protein
MYTVAPIFSQLMSHVPWRRFDTCVNRYQGDYKVKSFTCGEHFRVLAFAQLTFRESLRDIETCLRALSSRLYHMGIRSTISRNNLAHANETRDWRIYADFAQVLIAEARQLYAEEDLGVDLDATVYALDSTTIDLCLALFPWAPFRNAKAAIKLHTLLNLRGNIPEFIHISDGLYHDVNVLDLLVPMPGAFYIMDRAYLDFERLYALHQAQSFFVTRARKRFNFQRRYSHPVDRSTGLICDQTILLTTFYPAKKYPDPLRRIRYFDAAEDRTLVFLTNNFQLDAMTIAELFKARWQIELFFKWIKQHLRIKAFYGTSANAVKTQIWSAIATYLIVAILRKRLQLDQSLYTILQVLSVSLFEQMPILQALSENTPITQPFDAQKQLLLFD